MNNPRKSIIEDAANPKPYIAQTYNAATAAIAADIAASGKGKSTVAEAIADLKVRLKDKSLQDWQLQHVRLCLEATKNYQGIKPKLKLDGAKILPANVGPGNIQIAGLRVNISPEAIVVREEGNEIRVGAIKFYFSKSKQLGKQRADYAGALMHWYCEKHLKKHGVADYRCSLLVDLPGSVVHCAPKAKIRNRQNIEAACEEIVAMWPD